MRVAFPAFVDTSWTGGLNYLRNLFSALADLPGRPVQPVLFIPGGADPQAYRSLRPYLADAPIAMPHWASKRWARVLKTTFTGNDARSLAAFRAADIDLVFYNDAWYGSRFALPTLAWITDFQHCRMPELFTRWQRARRSAKFSAYVKHANRVMVSSEDSRNDCEKFFPAARGNVDVVRFAVQIDNAPSHDDTTAVLTRHQLPARFFYFPGQLWQHKNHLLVLDALRKLVDAGTPVVVVASGSAKDTNHPDYPDRVLQRAKDLGLAEHFRFLGLIAYADLMPLMRLCTAVLNPSLFEGWSTTVEEAKALGVPLVLSDLPVHREQAPAGTRFFDPLQVNDLTRVLAQAWCELPAGPRLDSEAAALACYAGARAEFAVRFVAAARRAVLGQDPSACATALPP